MKELNENLFNGLGRFLFLDAKIKELKSEHEALAKEFKETLKAQEGYDPMEKYRVGNVIEFSTNASNSIDVEAAIKALEKPALRHLLFPAAVTFKPVSTKDGQALALAHGLLIQGRSEPMLKVVAK